jgi:hypothetical protein
MFPMPIDKYGQGRDLRFFNWGKLTFSVGFEGIACRWSPSETDRKIFIPRLKQGILAEKIF